MKRILSFLIVLTSLVIAGNRLNAQANNYSCVLKNIHLASATELEFDIWLQWTGTNTAYLASLEAGINFNYAGIANGGTLTGSFVPGSADPSLPAIQQTLNCEVNATSLQFRVFAALVSPNTSATQIPTSAAFRIGRFRITNTVAFTTGVTPNFTWSFTPTTANTTRSRITAYINNSTVASGLVIQAGHTVANNYPLPAALVNFTVSANGLANQLNWTTAFEQNNKSFLVEYASDGVAFKTLAEVHSKASNGNSNETIKYNFLHTDVPSGISYYRLKQRDLDGSEHLLSEVISIKRSGNTAGTFYPNPAIDQVTVQLECVRPSQASIRILALNGRIVLNRTLSLEAGMNQCQFPITDLPAGMYLIQALVQNEQVLSASLQKQ